MNTPRKFAVLGNPIKHSLSPRLHALFAQQTGLLIEYSKQCVEPAHFCDHVKQFFASGGSGLNITLPFKEQAYALAQSRISNRARLPVRPIHCGRKTAKYTPAIPMASGWSMTCCASTSYCVTVVFS